MKASTAFASTAAIALMASAVSLSARASVIAQFDPLSGLPDYAWVQNGSGGEFFTINSPANTTAQAVATEFSFLTPGFTSLTNLPTLLTIDATAASGNPATAGAAGTWTQTGLDGSFKLLYNGANTTIGGVTLTTGENLLSGTFSDAWIQGADESGSTNLTSGNGGSATFTSSVLNLAGQTAGSQQFAFNLLGVDPPFKANTGMALMSFNANGGGNFTANIIAVPEPSDWALMILGFGGAGAMLRGRRTLAKAKA